MAKSKFEKDRGDKPYKTKETGKFRDQIAVKGGRGETWAVKSDTIGRASKVSRTVTGNKIVAHSGHVNVKHGIIDAAGNFYGGGFHIASASEKISIIKKGISKKELENIKDQSNLDYETLSTILSVSKAKLHSKKGTEKFDQNTSERIMLLADVIGYGQSVFEDKDSFNEWLKTNNKALGNKAPIELMDTIYGIDEVKKEIGRIEYGVF